MRLGLYVNRRLSAVSECECRDKDHFAEMPSFDAEINAKARRFEATELMRSGQGSHGAGG